MEQDQLEFMAPTITRGGKRLWLYPERLKGQHASRRRFIAVILMVIYLALPWVTLDSTPLLRFDFLGGRLYFLGQILQLSEASFLAFPLVGLALLLFFLTTWRGRIWCGYACPQTVFVEWLIRPIEELLEGSARHRKVEDAKPLTIKRGSLKLIKHVLYLFIAFIFSNVFLAYFIEPKQLLTWISTSPIHHPWAFGGMVFVLSAFYFDLAWFREQFCAFLCPYARFQSVMIDRHTPLVTYDDRRGEPRGKRASGHCIDCGLCQRVCPTGIDIRHGLQLECINCNRCSDACNIVMKSLKRPANLIATISQSELQGGKKLGFFARPRLLIYGVLMVIAFAFPVVYLRLIRDDISLKFTRQPGTAFSTLPDGRYANAFNLRSVNHTSKPMMLTLISDVAGVEVLCGSCQELLPPFSVRSHALILVIPQDKLELDSITLQVKGTDEKFVVPVLLPGKN